MGRAAPRRSPVQDEDEARGPVSDVVDGQEFEENRRIAWAHVGGHRWRYELEEVDGGTRVTESFDWSTSRAPASSRWSAIRSGTRPICRRPSSDSKRSLPGVRLDRAKRQSRPGASAGRSAANASSVRRSTAEHESFQVQAVAMILAGNGEAAGATTIDGEPIDLSCSSSAPTTVSSYCTMTPPDSRTRTWISGGTLASSTPVGVGPACGARLSVARSGTRPCPR